MANRGINKVILIGNLGADPEIRYLSDGRAVASLRVATTESWKDRQSGETQEHTEWHRVVFFGRPAEIIGEYLAKGSQIYLEGQLRTRKWTDDNGNDRYVTEIIGRELRMLGSANGGQKPDRGKNASAQPASKRARKPEPALEPAGDDFDDDIPF